MRGPPCQNALGIQISTVESRDLISTCPLSLILLASSKTHQIDRRMGLGEMRREGRCQDSTGSLIRPVVQRSCHGAQRTQSMVRWTGAVICAVGQGVFTQNHSFSGISICFTPGLLVRIEVQADTFLSHGAPFRSRKSVSFYQRKDFSALTLLAKV